MQKNNSANMSAAYGDGNIQMDALAFLVLGKWLCSQCTEHAAWQYYPSRFFLATRKIRKVNGDGSCPQCGQFYGS